MRMIKILTSNLPTYRDGRLPPIVLNVLLHIHCLNESLDDAGWKDSPARRQTIRFLLSEDLIRPYASSNSGFRCTERGNVHCEALKHLKLPPRN